MMDFSKGVFSFIKQRVSFSETVCDKMKLVVLETRTYKDITKKYQPTKKNTTSTPQQLAGYLPDWLFGGLAPTCWVSGSQAVWLIN